MSRPLDLRFITSVPAHSGLRDAGKEVAIVGRSNVGKSSLVNALANRKALAHTSKTPGRTQLLVQFSLEDGGSVVDLPGYGYSAVPGRVKSGWAAMIEGYLRERDQLVRVLVLVDGEIGPTKLDLQMLEWLQAEDLEWQIIATKQDKVASSKRQKRKRDLAEACGASPSDVIGVSVHNGAGIDTVRDLIRALVAP